MVSLSMYCESFNSCLDLNLAELKPEASPKWKALSEILEEIQGDISGEKNDPEEHKKVLLLVQDRIACNQIKSYLTMGAGEYLLDKAMKKLQLNKICNSRYTKTVETSIIRYKNVLIRFSDKKEEPAAATDPILDNEDSADKDSYVLTQKLSGDERLEQFEECPQV